MGASRAVERSTLVAAIVLLGLSLGGNILFFSNTKYLRTQANDALLKTDSMLSVKLLLEKEIDKGKSDLVLSNERIAEMEKQLVAINYELNKKAAILQLLRKDTVGLKQMKQENIRLANLIERNDRRSKDLIEEKAALGNELRSLKAMNASILNKTAELEKQLAWAKELRAQIISYENVKLKHDNPKQTLKAKKVNKLTVTFELDENPVAEAGTRDIYLVVYDTKGKIISSCGKKFFDKKHNKEIVYSAMQKVHYNKSKQRFGIEVDYEAKLTEGRYTFELYIDGNHSSRNEFALQ